MLDPVLVGFSNHLLIRRNSKISQPLIKENVNTNASDTMLFQNCNGA